MLHFLIIGLFTLSFSGCAELMTLKSPKKRLLRKKAIAQLDKKPDPLYYTLKEMRKIKAEEFYLDKEQECWERSYSHSREYESCISRKKRQRREARRYIKRDKLIDQSTVIPQNFKYQNIRQ